MQGLWGEDGRGSSGGRAVVAEWSTDATILIGAGLAIEIVKSGKEDDYDCNKGKE